MLFYERTLIVVTIHKKNENKMLLRKKFETSNFQVPISMNVTTINNVAVAVLFVLNKSRKFKTCCVNANRRTEMVLL